MELISKNRCEQGFWLRYQHESETCQSTMTFSVYKPDNSTGDGGGSIFWLSGLTCNDQNFVQKAGAARMASRHNVLVVAPDTSPRGDQVPDDKDSWDFASGAGFYVDATQEPWAKHYRMYSYISDELYSLVAKEFAMVPESTGIMGHSMGGHGALTIGLKNPDKFSSVSAFAPICAPTQCPWGEKALGGYLGNRPELWPEYDACELIKAGNKLPQLLVDQGSADEFLQEQLKPELLKQACDVAGIPLQLNYREEFDHSYFFISSFIDSHFEFHIKQWS